MSHAIRILIFMILNIPAISSFAANVLLKQSQVSRWTGDIGIDVCYDLGGNCISIPEGCTLIIGNNGGFCNGTIHGSHTSIRAHDNRPFFDTDVCIRGSWNVPEIFDSWFMFNNDKDFISNNIINNIFSLASDSVFNHIFFKEKRVYYFEHPYKGNSALGDMVSYSIKNGKKNRNYSEIFNDDYSFLRIFTIPSMTHLTVDNTIQMLPTDQGAYFVFWEYDKHDVIIDGSGSIAGDASVHRYSSPFAGKYYYGEYGHVFCCQKCSNFTFKNITIRDAFGDCIMFRGSLLENEVGVRWASGLTMENVNILNGRRNGLVIAARNVKISQCHFEGCGSDQIRGTLPKSAIDIESDKLSKYSDLGSKNVVVENCTFHDNVLDLSSVHNTVSDFGKNVVTIRKCVFSDPIKLNACYWIKFQDCKIKAVHNTAEEETSSFKCKNMTFENCTFEHLKISAFLDAPLKKVHFVKCKYKFIN